MYSERRTPERLAALRRKWRDGWTELADMAPGDRSVREFSIKSTRSFTVLLESISEGAILSDASGTIVYANQRAGELFAASPDELVGLPVEELLPEELRARHVRLRSDYARAPQIRPMGSGIDLVARRLDGTTFPTEVSLSVLDDGEDRIFIAFVTDITARKQQEQMLVQAGKMAAIGELAGNIAHEVNNPIGIISAKARLLLSSEQEQLTAKARSDLEKIVEQCDRLGKLTRGLLDFSRPSLGEKQPLDAHQPLRSAIGMVADRCRKHRIELRERLFADRSEVVGNGNELQQIFLNLLLNAIDAMPDGGTLTIESGNPDGRALTISVSDTGPGIPAEHIARVFEPFFTTKGASGTGLGLAICQGLARSHNGELQAHSGPDGGTAFTLRLPLITDR